jgi:hypothetical protein
VNALLREKKGGVNREASVILKLGKMHSMGYVPGIKKLNIDSSDVYPDALVLAVLESIAHIENLFLRLEFSSAEFVLARYSLQPPIAILLMSLKQPSKACQN